MLQTNLSRYVSANSSFLWLILIKICIAVPTAPPFISYRLESACKPTDQDISTDSSTILAQDPFVS